MKIDGHYRCDKQCITPTFCGSSWSCTTTHGFPASSNRPYSVRIPSVFRPCFFRFSLGLGPTPSVHLTRRSVRGLGDEVAGDLASVVILQLRYLWMFMLCSADEFVKHCDPWRTTLGITTSAFESNLSRLFLNMVCFATFFSSVRTVCLSVKSNNSYCLWSFHVWSPYMYSNAAVTIGTELAPSYEWNTCHPKATTVVNCSFSHLITVCNACAFFMYHAMAINMPLCSRYSNTKRNNAVDSLIYLRQITAVPNTNRTQLLPSLYAWYICFRGTARSFCQVDVPNNTVKPCYRRILSRRSCTPLSGWYQITLFPDLSSPMLRYT